MALFGVEHFGFVALAINLAVAVAVSGLTKPPDAELIERFENLLAEEAAGDTV